MSRFVEPPFARDALPLFPPMVDENDAVFAQARFVDVTLRGKTFAPLFKDLDAQYCFKEGRPAIPPIYLTCLYIYGAMVGIRSSRKLEKACRNRIDVIWLMQGITADHSTIAEFLKQHGKVLDPLFCEILTLARVAGLLDLKRIAVDGTKIEANASKSSVRSEQDIEELIKESEKIATELRRTFEENDQREQSLFEEETSKAKPEAELKQVERKLEKLEAVKAAIARRRDAASRPNETKSVGSLTDPDARRMKDKKGQVTPNYNVQIAVDSTAGLIVAEAVNDRADDSGLLAPMVEQVEKNTGVRPEAVVADCAYNTGPDLESLEQKNVEVYVPEPPHGKAKTPAAREALELLRAGQDLTEEQWAVVPKGSNHKISREAFTYLPEQDAYRCPKGQILVGEKTVKDVQRCGTAWRKAYRAPAEACLSCPIAARCCEQPKTGRTVSRDQHEEVRERTRSRVKTPKGRSMLALRSPLAETPTGMLKGNWNFRRFLRRGFAGVRIESTLNAIAYNLMKLMKHLPLRPSMGRLDSG